MTSQIYEWQQSQWQALSDRVAQDRLAHALLFKGPKGVGKLDFVQTLVARLFCQSPANDHACGRCNNCHLLSVNNHPDIKLIECDEGKKNIAVDQIRNLIEYMGLTPHSAPFKIGIVNHAELMSVSAANSLLKTLEEPPASALIFLLTHRPEQLLPTIHSRCQVVSFNMPDPQVADKWLSQFIADKESRAAVLSLASGAPLTALELEKQGSVEIRKQQMQSLMDLIGGKIDPVSVAEKWQKQDQELTLKSLLSWVIDLARIKSANETYITNNDMKSNLETLQQKTNLQALIEFHDFLNNCMTWTRQNVNNQLLLEDILIRWTKLFR